MVRRKRRKRLDPLWEQTLVAIWRAAAVIQSTRSFSKKCAGRCTTATPPIATKVCSHRIFRRPANQATRWARRDIFAGVPDHSPKKIGQLKMPVTGRFRLVFNGQQLQL